MREEEHGGLHVDDDEQYEDEESEESLTLQERQGSAPRLVASTSGPRSGSCGRDA